MSFSIVEANAYRDKAVQQLITFPKGVSPVYIDATVDVTLEISELASSKSLYFHNGGAAATLTLPTEDELVTLFSQPETGAILAWNTYNDNASNITIETAEDAAKNCILTSLIGIFMLILEDYDPDTGVAIINVGYIPSSSSFPCPKPKALAVTGHAVLEWDSFNFSSASPQAVYLTGTAVATLTMGSALSLWQNMFGSITSLATVGLFANTVCIINGTNQTITIENTAGSPVGGDVIIEMIETVTVGAPGSVVVTSATSFALAQYELAELRLKVRSMTGNPPTTGKIYVAVKIYPFLN